MSRRAPTRIAPRIAKMLAAVGFAAALATSFTSSPAPAAPLKLPDGVYRYTVIDQDVVAALQAFGSNLKLKINISSEVSGRVQGKWPEVSPREFLDWLSGQGNFEWYFDGLVLHISAVKEAQTRIFVLPPITLDQFTTALDALSVSDDRYRIQSAPGNALVKVAGPPRFVALAEQTLNGLIAEQRTRPTLDGPSVRISTKAVGNSGRSPTRRPPIASSGSRPPATKAPAATWCHNCQRRQLLPHYPRPHVEARNGDAPGQRQDCRAPQTFPPYPRPHGEACAGDSPQE